MIRRLVRKIIKFFIYFLLISFIVTLIIQIPYVQTKITHVLTKKLSEELGTEVRIGHVNIKYLSNIDLEGVYVADYRKDTLFYAQHLSLSLPYYLYNFNELYIKQVKADGFIFNYTFYKGEKDSNLDVFLAHFESDTSSKSQEFRMSSVILKTARFNYTNEDDSSHLSRLNFSNINAHIEDFKVFDKNIYFDVRDLACETNKNNQIKKIKGHIRIQEESISAQNLSLLTHYSSLYFPYFFYALTDFQTIPDLSFESTHSSVSSADFLTWITGRIYPVYNRFDVHGILSTKRDKIDLKNMVLGYGLQTRLALNGYVQFSDTTHFLKGLEGDVKMDRLTTNRNELNSLVRFAERVANIADTVHVELPTWITSLNELSFSGEVQKKETKSFLEGHFLSDAGKIFVSLNADGLSSDDLSLEGKVSSKNFNFTKFINNDSVVSNISSNIAFDIKLHQNFFTSQLQGSIDTLFVYNTPYHNISLKGTLTEDLFSGNISSADDKLNFVFDGLIRFKEKQEEGDFSLKVNTLKLDPFRVLPQYPGTTVAFNSKVMFTKNEHNDYQGSLKMQDLVLNDNRNKPLKTNDLYLVMAPTDQDNIFLTLENDYFNASYLGDLRFSKNVDQFKRYFQSIFLNQTTSNFENDHSFNFYLQTKKIQPLLSYLFDQINLSELSVIQIQHRDPKQNYASVIKASIPQFSYQKMNVSRLDISSQIQSGELVGQLHCNHFNMSDELGFSNISLTGKTKFNHQFHYAFNTMIDPDSILRLNFEGDIGLLTSSIIHANIDENSLFSIQDQTWQLSSKFDFNIDSTFLYIQQFYLSKDQQFIRAKAHFEQEHEIRLEYQDFDLSLANAFFQKYNLNIQGIANGKSDIRIQKNTVIPVVDMRVDNFEINEQILGTGHVFAQYIPTEQNVYLKSNFDHDMSQNSISISGKYNIASQDNALNIQLQVMPLNFTKLSPYFKGVLSELEGFGDVNLHLSGSFKKPILAGSIDIDSLQFKVDYLKTKYHLSHQTMQFKQDWIGLNNVDIYDEDNNTAKANLTLYHENFKNLNYDVNIDVPKSFKFLNTKAKDNDYFYGQAYLNEGRVNIAGYGKVINMEVDGSTGPNTKISIPMDAPAEISNSGFLVIRDKNVVKQKKEKEKVRLLPGLNLDFNINVNSDAKWKVIFDEQAGDVINAEGNGKLQMTINDVGKFQMYGEYVMEKGDYLFTYEKVINKKFQISPGSTISWSGDPFKAYINVDAIYRLRTSLSSLMATTDSTSSNNMAGRRVPIDCKMHLTKDLMNPTIGFDIELPTISLSDPVQDVLKSVMNTEDAKRWQFFSLLILNKFDLSNSGGFATAPSTAAAPVKSSITSAANPYELLSNQLSSFLSKSTTDKVNLELNYRPGDHISAEEMQVGVSTQLFNDRLSVEGNLGVSNTSNAARASTAQSTSGIAGDVYVEYRLSKSGSTSVKAYNKSNNVNLLDANNSPYTQGVGLSFKKDFNNLGDLFRSIFKKKEKK